MGLFSRENRFYPGGQWAVRITDANFAEASAWVEARSDEELDSLYGSLVRDLRLDEYSGTPDFPVTRIVATFAVALTDRELECGVALDTKMDREDQVECERFTKSFNEGLEFDRKIRADPKGFAEWAVYIFFTAISLAVMRLFTGKTEDQRFLEDTFLKFFCGDSSLAKQRFLSYAKRFGYRETGIIALARGLRDSAWGREIMRFNRGMRPAPPANISERTSDPRASAPPLQAKLEESGGSEDASGMSEPAHGSAPQTDFPVRPLATVPREVEGKRPKWLSVAALIVVVALLALVGPNAWRSISKLSGETETSTVSVAPEPTPADSASTSTDAGRTATGGETQAEATFVRRADWSGNSIGGAILRVGSAEPAEYVYDSGTAFFGNSPAWEEGERWWIRYVEDDREGEVVRRLTRVESPDAVPSTYGTSAERLLAAESYFAMGEAPWPADGETVWTIIHQSTSELRLVRSQARVSKIATDEEYGAEMSVRIDGYAWCGHDDGQGPIAPPCVAALFSGNGFNEGDMSTVHVSPVGLSDSVSHRSGFPSMVFATAEYGQVPPAGYSLLFPDFRNPNDPGEEYALRFDRQGDVWLASGGTKQKLTSNYNESGGTAGLVLHLAGDLDRDGKLDLILNGPGGPQMFLSRLRKKEELVGDTGARQPGGGGGD